MIDFFRKQFRENWKFSFYIFLSLMIIFMFAEMKNHRFLQTDFEVYYRAAGRLFQGENLYRPVEDGHFHYKYSPVAAVFFLPFSLASFPAARVLYWLFLSGATLFCFYLSLTLIKPDFKKSPEQVNRLLLVAGLILGLHVQQELHLGQVNQLLLLSYVLMFYLFLKGKTIPAAILWAAGIFLKPFGFIFLPYFLIKRRYGIIAYFVAALVLFSFVPLVFYGAHDLIGQNQHWFRELEIELSHKQNLLAAGNHTLFSVMARFTPLRYLHFTSSVARIYQITGLILLGSLMLYTLRRGRSIPQSNVLEFAFLTSLIPLLAFTSSNAFIFTELAVLLILFNFDRLHSVFKYLAAGGFIALGINMHDLVGDRIFQYLEGISLVAWGAIAALVVLLFLRIKEYA